MTTTPAKGLTQPQVGGDNNTWGGELNTDLALIDSALGGTLAKSISGNVTLSGTEAQNSGYHFTGTLSGTATLTWPSFSGQAAIRNATTGGFPIVCGISGASVTVLNGETVAIWSDGTDFIRLVATGGGATVPNSGLTNSAVTISGHSLSLGGTLNLASGDVSGLAASATTDTTSASNITSGTLPNARLSAVPNSALANSSVTISGHSLSLGSTLNLASGDVSGLAAVATSGSASDLGTGTLPNGRLSAVPNSALANSSLTIAGHSVSLGGTQTLAAADLTDGTTGSGTIILSSALSPAPNILINPVAEIDQANEGSSVSLASGTAAYVVDGWQAAFHSSTAVVTAQRVADGPRTFPNSLKLTVSTGAAVAAGDYLYVRQPIEANNLADIALGTASAQTVSLTFWVKSSIASYTMSGSIQNFAQTRSYPFNLSVSSSATWTKCTVSIPGDTSGSWVTSGTAGGMYLVLAAAAGSTFQGTVNTWAGSNLLGTSSNTNTVLSTSSATFQITGVKLEVSPVPTPYGRLNFEDELARCQRLYTKSYDQGTAPGSATHVGMVACGFNQATYASNYSVVFGVPMRAAPSITIWDGAGNTSRFSSIPNTGGSTFTDNNLIAGTLSSVSSTKTFSPGITSGQGNAFLHYSADARL